MKTFILLISTLMIQVTSDAQTTEMEWQQEAVKRFPEISVKDSPLNKMFLSEYNRLKQSTPDFFRNNPNWPVIIASQCSAQLSNSGVIPGLDNPPVRPEPKAPTGSNNGSGQGRPNEIIFPKPESTNPALQAKLNKIIFPQIDFRDATLSECVDFINAKSKTLDPQRVGISVVIAPSTPPSTTGLRLTLSLKNVPEMEILNYMAYLCGLKFRIDASGVTLLSK